MRSIGHLETQAQAQRFVDYLLTQGISAQADPARGGTWTVWVHDDAHLDRAEELLRQYADDPAHPRFGEAAAQAKDLRARDAEEQEAYRRRMMDRDRIFPDRKPVRPGPLTMLLVAACAFIFVKTMGGEGKLREALFISAEPDGLSEIRSGEFWRLLTPMFLHFGLLHLVFNLGWLFGLGSQIESRLSSFAFFLRVVVFSLAANLVQYAVGGPSFGGMSGVVYGLIGYIWLRGKLDPASGLYLSKTEWVLALIWFGLCFTGLLGPVANGGHAGGLGAGLVWAWISSRRRLR